MRISLACLILSLTALPASARAGDPAGIDTDGMDRNAGTAQLQEPRERPERPADSGARSQGGTGALQASGQPLSISMDQFERDRDEYIGKRVIVKGEVDTVLGPHLFTIDDGNWFDLHGDTLVYLPAPHLGLVSDDDPITVAGTVRRFTDVELHPDRDWFGFQPPIEAEIAQRPVIVASSIVSEDGMVLGVSVSASGGGAARRTGYDQPPAEGTSGSTGTTGDTGGSARNATGLASVRPISTLEEITGTTTRNLVGREVQISEARVAKQADKGRFWISGGPEGEQVLVVPAVSGAVAQPGRAVGIEGFLLRMPEAMRDSLRSQGPEINDEIYVYATGLQRRSQ